MFILVNILDDTCSVLDTEDFEVDKVSKSFCKGMLKKGYSVSGVTKTGSTFKFEPQVGVLPDKFKDETPAFKSSLLCWQMRGLNLLTAKNVYTHYK